MWPLCEDADADAKRDEEREVNECADAGRAFFNEYKTFWTRNHDTSVRALPPVLAWEFEDTLVKAATARLCSEASARLQVVQVQGCQPGEVGKSKSIWSKCESTKTKNNAGGSSNSRETARLIRRIDKDQPSFIGMSNTIDRGDRGRELGALARLQLEASSLYDDRIHEFPAESGCRSVMASITGVVRSKDRQPIQANRESRIHSKVERPKVTGPRLVRCPWLSRKTARNHAWRTVANEAAGVLASILSSSETTAYSCGHICSNQVPHIPFKILSTAKNRASIQRVELVAKSPSTLARSEGNISNGHQPRRVKFDGLIKTAQMHQPLCKAALAVFKQIVKKNASLFLTRAVPETLAHNIGSLLRRANSASRMHQRTNSLSCNGLHLRALPPEVLKFDDDQLDASQRAIKAVAAKTAKSDPLLAISLTTLSVSIPSFWRQDVVTTIAQQVKTKTWSFQFEMVDPSASHSASENRDNAARLGVNSLQTTIKIPETEEEDKRPNCCISEAQALISCETPESNAPIPMDQEKRVLAFKIEGNVCTDELVTSFLLLESDEAPLNSNHPEIPAIHVISTDKFDQRIASAIDEYARPAIWFLGRLKLVKVESGPMGSMFQTISLEVLEAAVFQLHSKLRDISFNPAKVASDDILEACTAFRSSMWLHALRYVHHHSSQIQPNTLSLQHAWNDGLSFRMIAEQFKHSSQSAVAVISRLVESSLYREAIGGKHIQSLSTLFVLLGGHPESLPCFDCEGKLDVTDEFKDRPMKKPRLNTNQLEPVALRVLCSRFILEKDDLLIAMSDLGITVIERDLPPYIDIVVDEHNAVVLLQERHLSEEHLMKAFTYELATAQVQFQKLWLVTRELEESEPLLHCFYAALANFQCNVQVFACKGDGETSDIIRGIIDACAEDALSRHRVLPKMWFARPFMLEEESQLERFMSSTRIMNAFAAQSVLHKLSFAEIESMSLEEGVRALGSSINRSQVGLLWRMLHSDYGIASNK